MYWCIRRVLTLRSITPTTCSRISSHRTRRRSRFLLISSIAVFEREGLSIPCRSNLGIISSANAKSKSKARAKAKAKLKLKARAKARTNAKARPKPKARAKARITSRRVVPTKTTRRRAVDYAAAQNANAASVAARAKEPLLFLRAIRLKSHTTWKSRTGPFRMKLQRERCARGKPLK